MYEYLEFQRRLSVTTFDQAKPSEPKLVERGLYKGQSIGVLTSGGDAQGMNGAVRAVVRMAIYVGCKAYFIREGYQGMIEGGDNIVEAEWSSVSGIIHLGGTIIGSARSAEFRELPGRLEAAYNLIQKGITNLVIIGGDGSLTGANKFKEDWSSLLDELCAKGRISDEVRRKYAFLNIVGLVGSIDNDFCGTDMTIGTDSALHRIIEATDAIASTAYSHKRTFIMEVMGRHCGYLTVVSGLCTEADFIFIPENPPAKGWQKKLCDKLQQERNLGRRLNIIIVAEGATELDGSPITSEIIKNVVIQNLQQDARVTVLGHVQRGGNPSAFDRILGCRMGAEAVLALMDKNTNNEACVISLDGNQVVRLPLMGCVNQTKAVAKAMADKNFDLAVQLRGKSFQGNLDTFKLLTRTKPPAVSQQQLDAGFVYGVMSVGTPACGANAAVRSFVRNAICRGDVVYAIHNGIEGLVTGYIRRLNWADVDGWVSVGGIFIGTKETLPGNRLNAIATRLSEFGIQGLLIVGGFEAYLTGLEFLDARPGYTALQIPIIVLPCTINNNVPGTEFSLGCDTALNAITNISDSIRQSAQGTKRRVFIIETMGGYCGYLATVGGLAGGADSVYIFEEKYTVKDLELAVSHMTAKMNDGVLRGLVLRNEFANENYDSDFLRRLYSQEGKGVFSTRLNVIGHMQQGGSPTPFDRTLGTKMGAKSVAWISECLKTSITGDGRIVCNTNSTVVLLGVVRRQYKYTPLSELREQTDFKHRLPNQQWWLKLCPLLRILAKHDSVYEEEGTFMTAEEKTFEA